MEDVLDVYTRPYDPLYPVVCLDESNKQLIKETCPRMPLEPGQPQRQTINMNATGSSIYSCCLNPWQVGGTSR
jgi:hypothetical protein